MSEHEDLLADLFDMDDSIHVERTTYDKAPIGWVGGKSNSLKHIIPVIKRHLTRKWVDVFGGSGIVSLNVPDVELMVYNDRYSGVVDFYRVLQSNKVDELINHLDNLCPPLSREMWIHYRATWCQETDPVIRAAKWFYVFRNSVIGKGQSFARSTNSRPPIVLPNSLELFRPVHQKMKRFIIENLDFRVCMKDFDSPDAVMYLDPPYVGTDPGIYEHKFKQDDLRELLKIAEHSKATILLSGYSNELIDGCTFWNDRITWKVPLTSEVQAFTDENNKTDRKNIQDVDQAEEVLWVKYGC